MKYVMFYESADDVAGKAPAHFPAHRARLEEFHAHGTLLMVGTFGNPQEEGSMGIFTTREAAEEFIKGDPFVLNGVVRSWRIHEWNEVPFPWMSTIPSPSARNGAIHQEVDFEASPEGIYEALLDEQRFGAFTGAAAQIEPQAGGAFRLFGGRVSGRNVELIPGQRIVQAWRIEAWPSGLYAIVRFELVTKGLATCIVFDEAGFPPRSGKLTTPTGPRCTGNPCERIWLRDSVGAPCDGQEVEHDHRFEF